MDKLDKEKISTSRSTLTKSNTKQNCDTLYSNCLLVVLFSIGHPNGQTKKYQEDFSKKLEETGLPKDYQEDIFNLAFFGRI